MTVRNIQTGQISLLAETCVPHTLQVRLSPIFIPAVLQMRSGRRKERGSPHRSLSGLKRCEPPARVKESCTFFAGDEQGFGRRRPRPRAERPLVRTTAVLRCPIGRKKGFSVSSVAIFPCPAHSAQ